MTENASHENMEPFKNPDCVPLEDLKLTIKTDGVSENVDALNKRWVSDRYFLHYEAPKIYDDDGAEIMAAKDQWIEIVRYMIDDLRWLLSLPFYKYDCLMRSERQHYLWDKLILITAFGLLLFWSNVVYNPSILNALVSFLQEAPPFYALENFPGHPEMQALLETLSRYMLVVFTRLVTNKESPEEYMNRPFLGELLYDNYIFTVPIIFDLCQLYGRDNEKIVKKILNCLFTLEPRYNTDFQKAIPCLIEALENVEIKFDGRHYTNEAVLLPKSNANSKELTLFNIEDMILYVLDISSTISVFLKNYPPAVSIFHKEDFMNKLVTIYDSTIPEMYKTLDKLACNDENMPKYIELKHRLDVTRIEIINLFRIIIYEPILNIQETKDTISEEEIKRRVDEYLDILSNAISGAEFMIDYDRFYPIQVDLETLKFIYPEVDTVKCNFILKGVNVSIGKPNSSSNAFSNNVNEAVAGPSGVSNRTTAASGNANSSNKKRASVAKNSVELASLVSEVKDILCDLDERFIERSLEYYDYNSADVINAVLENTLPPELKELENLSSSEMPSGSAFFADTRSSEDLACGFEALHIPDDYYEDNVRVKPRKEIEVAKAYITANYSLTDMYEDEYDDTYDDRNIRGNVQDDPTGIGSRPFTTPRVLRTKGKVETIEESEPEDEDTGTEQNGRDHFIQNPEEVRAKAEQRRQAMRGGRAASDVIGKSRGEGQDKSVLHNRQQKNTHKAKRANHDRRSGAQWKRNQGMVPS